MILCKPSARPVSHFSQTKFPTKGNKYIPLQYSPLEETSGRPFRNGQRPTPCTQRASTSTDMAKRNERLEALRLILSRQEANTQEHLILELAKMGHHVTQSTLSRDLSALHAVKAGGEKGNCYLLPQDPRYRRAVTAITAPEFLRHTGFLSLDFSGNIAVMRTRPGYAAVLAGDIDRQHLDGILGTVAGQDTIIIVLHTDITRQEAIDQLAQAIPAIKSVVL